MNGNLSEVRSFIETDFLTVERDLLLLDIFPTIEKYKYILVVENNQLIGILNFVHLCSLYPSLISQSKNDLKVEDAMTKDFMVLKERDLIQEINNIINIENVDYIPVVNDENQPVGLMKMSNLYQWQIKRLQTQLEIEKNLQQITAKRFREAQKIAKIGNWEYDLSNNTLYWSDQVYEIFGINSQLSQTSIELFISRIHPDDRDWVMKSYENHLHHQIPYHIIHRLLLADGKIKYVQEQCQTEYNNDGIPCRSIGTVQDVTLKQESDNIIKNIIEATSTAINGQEFFTTLVTHIAEAVNKPYVLISELKDDLLYSLAYWVKGKLQDSIVYDFVDTPCENILKEGYFYCESGIKQQFPQDFFLQEISAESYIGIALKNFQNKILGHICILDEKPLAQESAYKIKGILDIFATRACAELIRMREDEQLQEMNAILEQKIKERTIELQESQQFITTILDTIPLPIFWQDRNSIFLGCNAKFAQIMGLNSSREIIGKNSAKISDLMTVIHQYFQTEIGEEEALLALEKTITFPNGKKLWIEIYKTPLKDSQGNITGLVGMFRDITQNKEAEIILQNKTDELDRFFSLALDLLCIASTDGYFIRLNKEWSHTLGYQLSELEGKKFLDLVHPEDLASTLQTLEMLGIGEEIPTFINRYRCHDGSYRYLEWRSKPYQNRVYAAARDITLEIETERERQQLIIALQKSNDILSIISKAQSQFITAENRLVIFEELLSDLLNLTDSQYGFIGEVLFKEDGKAVIEENFWKIKGVPFLKTHSITNIAWNEETQKYYEENFAQGMEFTNMNTLFGAVIMTGKAVIANNPSTDPRAGGTPEGHPPLNAFLGLPFFSGDNLVGVVGIANRPNGYNQSIIEYLQPFLVTCSILIEGYRLDRRKKQTEEQLYQSNKELMRVTRLKDEFLASMSHELRTPLNAILGNAEILQEEIFGEVNSQQRKSLETIEKSGFHLLELINDILDLSKIEAGQMTLDLSTTNIVDLCRSSLGFIQQQAFKKDLKINFDINDNLPEISIDQRRIRQVLINLLNNAVKFTPPSGQITLKTTLIQDEQNINYIRIIVQDTGIGISQENIKKLFQPFIQIDSALNRQYAGTGLGLALVKQIVQLHDGKVKVISEEGVGSSFIVDLPCNLMNSSELTVHSLVEKPLENKPSILLFIPNNQNLTIYNYLQAKNYPVMVIDRFSLDDRHCDLIIIDVEEIRQDLLSTIAKISQPMLLMIPETIDPPQQELLERERINYLKKPIRLKELVGEIEKLTNKG